MLQKKNVIPVVEIIRKFSISKCLEAKISTKNENVNLNIVQLCQIHHGLT